MQEQGAAGLVRHSGCEVKVYQFRKCISCWACSMLTLLAVAYFNETRMHKLQNGNREC